MIKWRRFVPLKDTKEVEKLIERKRLSREDLTLIFQSLDINDTVFPEIAESRVIARKGINHGMEK